MLTHLSSKAQSDIQHDWRVDPLLKLVHAKQPRLKMFGRKDGRGRYVNMAVLDENSRKLKWFTCHGVAFDSVQLNTDKYNGIIAGSFDPFTFYHTYCYENLYHIERAEHLYRTKGANALRDTAHNNRQVFSSASVKTAQSTLQKLIAIEGLMKKIYLRLRLFDSKMPRHPASNRYSDNITQENVAGTMVQKADSTTYYNTYPLAAAAKIVLRRRSADRLFVYNHEGVLIDSVPLRAGKYTSLLTEKEDVFLLYRGWLELQWQQVADAKRQYAGWLHKLDSSLYMSVSSEQSRQQLQNVIMSLQDQQNVIDSRISSLIMPEEKEVEQLLTNHYRQETSEISYVKGLGFAYTIAFIRGQKTYELPDHRGNVVAVVSDRKKGADENSDGIFEYYNADVVSSNDYYPFGMLQPGRGYNAGNKYRYGYNGKENDNEVKGEGNQQDYGMRIYDPRLGKFLSTDPLTREYPELTPYQFASNRPIDGVDLDGLEILEINSSAYRMKYLGRWPVLTNPDAVLVDVNAVETVQTNVPKGFKPRANVYVGTHGKDFYQPSTGLTIKPASDVPYLGDDDGESAQKTPKVKNQKVARIFKNKISDVKIGEVPPQQFNKVGALTTAPKDLYDLGKSIYDGIQSFNDMLVDVKEEKLRRAFYKATNIVDTELFAEYNATFVKDIGAISDIGGFRADLINYLVDGTGPSNFKGRKKNRDFYNSEVLRVGKVLMESYDIEDRTPKEKTEQQQKQQ